MNKHCMATKIASTFVFSRSKMTCSNPLYSILDTNYSILNTNYPTPSTQYSLLNTHSSLLSTYYSNLTFSSTSTTAPRYLAQCKWPVCMYLRHGPPQGTDRPKLEQAETNTSYPEPPLGGRKWAKQQQIFLHVLTIFENN